MNAKFQFLRLLSARARSLCYFYVYGYRHPKTGVWRYVGKGRTFSKYHDRKSDHLWYARRLDWKAEDYANPRLIHWVRKLLIEGLEPEIILLKEGMSSDQAYRYEAELVSRIGRIENGGTLYNLTAGGIGTRGLSEEARRKNSESQRGRKDSDDVRRKKSQAHLGKPSGMLGKQAWNKGILASEEARRRNSERQQGRPAWNKGKVGFKQSEDTCRKKSEAQKARRERENCHGRRLDGAS
jgi:hypothetical protein